MEAKADVRDSTVRISRFPSLSPLPVLCRPFFCVARVFTLQTLFSVQSPRTEVDGDMLPISCGLLRQVNFYVKGGTS